MHIRPFRINICIIQRNKCNPLIPLKGNMSYVFYLVVNKWCKLRKAILKNSKWPKMVTRI